MGDFVIYLDNAATSLPKPRAVVKQMTACVRHAANPGRSGHRASLKALDTVYACRCAVGEFFGLNKPENVIFTQNATHALNIAVKGCVQSGMHVITTSVEHNSVLRPINSFGVDYDIVWADKTGYVNPFDIERKIKPNTRLIVCTLASNVCGSVQPFEKIAAVAKKHGVLFLLDASQGGGSVYINMEKNGIDLLAAPGHKGLYGPMGTGVLCVNTSQKLATLTEGGTGSHSAELAQPEELPERFESGTLNVPGIAGLNAGIDFVNKVGISEILEHENKLASVLAEDIRAIHGVHVCGFDAKRRRIGVVSAQIDGFDSAEVAALLSDDYKIAVRAGYHCAYTAHQTLGTQNGGTVRFGIGAFNTMHDIKKTAFALNRIVTKK